MVVVDSSTLSVVFADDALLVREGVRRLLAGRSDIALVAECGTLEDTLAAVDVHLPDVVLTDIRMPPTETNEGIVIARTLRRTHPEVAVVVLSQHVSPDYALELFADGAARRGYVLKERLRDPSELIGPLRAVAAGGAYVDPRVVDALVAAQTLRAESGFAALTPEEREVLALIARGLSNAGIARELGANVRAVERRVASIFEKLGLTGEQHLNRRVSAALAYLAHVG